MNGIERGNILKQAIHLITETGAHLHSITFDGAPVNTSMCESLGTQFSTGKSYIINPVTKENIYCFPDPVHMIKLIRNAFGDKKVLKNGKGELIKWEYVVMLYEKEQEEGLRAVTKLTSRHIFFQNVRLASQLLSDSVGDVLLYMQTVDAKFEGCKATAEFCKIINNAFDILNVESYIQRSHTIVQLIMINLKNINFLLWNFKNISMI